MCYLWLLFSMYIYSPRSHTDYYMRVQLCLSVQPFRLPMAANSKPPRQPAVEQVIDHRTSLRYLGIPLATTNGSNASWLFGDNLSVVNSSVLPNGKLQKRSHLLNYHLCREAQASGVINFAHIDGAVGVGPIDNWIRRGVF